MWAEVEALRDDRRIRLRLGLANVAGAVLIAVQATAIGLPGNEGSTSPEAQALISGGLSLVYVAVAFVSASRVGDRRADRVFGWIDERRRPSPAEAREALLESLVNARRVLGWWLGAVVLLFALNVAFGNPLAYCGRFALDVLLGGIASSVLTYLVLERYNRPVFRIVLQTEEVRGEAGLDLRRRFVLTWLLSAVVPLVIMATAPVGLSRSHRADLLGPLLALLVVGLGAGWILTRMLARSVTEPLSALRAAHGEVRRGNLDVAVDVDDGGEVGVLQAEFNNMVEGLRERERLHDLFGRHVGIEVARHALDGGVRLGGERRAATVLFVDVVGSTAMAQRLEPEAVVAMLNDVFGAVVRCAQREGGWVNKFEGDAALCVFGPPGDDQHHAAAALQVARALRAELRQLATRHDGLDAGIGVSSGDVVAGNIGAEDRYEYTVIGDPVNEAARLTEKAKSTPARVLASGPAIDAAGETAAAEWRRVGRVRLRGRDGSTVVFAPDD